MKKGLGKGLIIMLLSMLLTDCAPPQIQYPSTQLVYNRRVQLKDDLLALLPKEEQGKMAAIEEATWLSDTAYKAAAGIARINGSYFPNWFGNALINARMQDRGLCWHYQHDMFRELRRRKLNFYRIGCCVRDKAESSEHNCVYIAPVNSEWPHAMMLDAWLYNGRLRAYKAAELNQERWEDLPTICSIQEKYYPAGHTWPIEHWSIIRGKDGEYKGFWTPDAKGSSQYRRMFENIEEGMKAHPNSPMNY